MLTSHIISALKKEHHFLGNMINDINKELRHLPSGSVQIRKHKKGIQFYHYTDPMKKEGKYLSVKKQNLALALVRKGYLLRLLGAAKKDHQLIEYFLKKYDLKALQEVFLKESPVRQNLLFSSTSGQASGQNTFLSYPGIILPDALYAETWENCEYERKPFSEDTPVHCTMRQERVRSKSEVLIANSLFRLGVPYRYECPLSLGNNVIHPDFTILRIADRKILYWEHLGMMDDTAYARSAVQRIEEYERNGIFLGEQLIITMETGRIPLNSIIVERLIRHHLLLE